MQMGGCIWGWLWLMLDFGHGSSMRKAAMDMLVTSVEFGNRVYSDEQ